MAIARITLNTVGSVVRDLNAAPAKIRKGGAKAVKKNGAAGHRLAQRYAQELSGPHGKSYYKRITGESLGAFEYEYGPHAGGLPVGGGWRHGTPNTELERSLDVIGPKFAADCRDIWDDVFW